MNTPTNYRLKIADTPADSDDDQCVQPLTAGRSPEPAGRRGGLLRADHWPACERLQAAWWLRDPTAHELAQAIQRLTRAKLRCTRCFALLQCRHERSDRPKRRAQGSMDPPDGL